MSAAVKVPSVLPRREGDVQLEVGDEGARVGVLMQGFAQVGVCTRGASFAVATDADASRKLVAELIFSSSDLYVNRIARTLQRPLIMLGTCVGA